ncbi:MAG: glycoside hydrolase family 1 protein [Chloroflexi bacterium]|nr:glycoside hydrolase family 1 protein [Chloroflexota bacterium]
MAQAQMLFPQDFLWGTATAAYQVEGNNKNSDWWMWEQGNGRILHNHKSGLASNWWVNAEADLDAAAAMGTNAHRLSLEWGRIEPEPSLFDENALARYREILLGMHDRGIEPMVTLHHFSNPLWLVEKGDFNSKIVIDYFQRYTAKVVDVLGDLIPKWITINEPMVYIFMRYLMGLFPAGKQSGWQAARGAVSNLLRCHAAAYHTIKSRLPQSLVGVAKNMTVLQARPNSSPFSRWWAAKLSWLFNTMWLDSMANGRLYSPVGRSKIPNLAGSFDFLGLNYYTRFYVNFPPRGELLSQQWEPSAVVSDGNYGELYAAGLFQMIEQLVPYKKPIYITENGVPDRADRLRPSFIITHLREVWRAISFNYPVMGYYHWSLIDNFEWDRGWTQRFGLIELDVETQERRLRKSGRLYNEICRSSSLTSQMAEKYAAELMQTIFRG